MDCKDLTIGDYVKYNEVTKIVDAVYLYSVSVHDPSEEWSISEAKTYPVDDIEPIPLTEDILVKNGFERQGDLYMYHIDASDWYLRIDLVDLQDGLWSYDIDSYDKFNDSLETHRNDRTFLKLHQLQHLLRLCGIDKELTI